MRSPSTWVRMAGQSYASNLAGLWEGPHGVGHHTSLRAPGVRTDKQRIVPDKFYKGGSQEKTLLRRLELFLLLSPLDGAGSVLTARTRCSVAGHCGPAI